MVGVASLQGNLGMHLSTVSYKKATRRRVKADGFHLRGHGRPYLAGHLITSHLSLNFVPPFSNHSWKRGQPFDQYRQVFKHYSTLAVSVYMISYEHVLGDFDFVIRKPRLVVGIRNFGRDSLICLLVFIEVVLQGNI